MKVKKCWIDDEPIGMAYTSRANPGIITMSTGVYIGGAPVLIEVYAIEPVHMGEILAEVKDEKTSMSYMSRYSYIGQI